MSSPPPLLAFFQNLGFPEMMVIGIVALLIFGRRLPEVGRSLGKGIVEFKKGLAGVEDEVKNMSSTTSAPPRQLDSKPPEPARTENRETAG